VVAEPTMHVTKSVETAELHDEPHVEAHAVSEVGLWRVGQAWDPERGKVWWSECAAAPEWATMWYSRAHCAPDALAPGWSRPASRRARQAACISAQRRT